MTLKKNRRTIVFFYPSMNIGGAQLLFIRLAKELCQHDNVDVVVVDFPNGFLATQLKANKDVEILPFKASGVQLYSGTVVVTPLSNVADFSYLIKNRLSDISVIFWSIRPDNLHNALSANGRKFLGDKQKVKEIIKWMSDAGQITYMDGVNISAAMRELMLPLIPSYLPIPIEEFKSLSGRKIREQGTINVGWLGRLDIDKINSIKKIVGEIQHFKQSRNMVFHIIGGGKKLSELQQYLGKSNIDYVLPGVLFGKELTQYLERNIDIGIAMGTSALEFAIRAIPVLLIDTSDSELPANIKYNWLYETENYSLGDYFDPKNIRKHTFEDVIYQLENDDQIGQKCFIYTRNNHDIKIVANKLYQQCLMAGNVDMSKYHMVLKLLNPPLFGYFYILYRKVVHTLQRSKLAIHNWTKARSKH